MNMRQHIAALLLVFFCGISFAQVVETIEIHARYSFDPTALAKSQEYVTAIQPSAKACDPSLVSFCGTSFARRGGTIDIDWPDAFDPTTFVKTEKKLEAAIQRGAIACNLSIGQLKATVFVVVKEPFGTSGIPPTRMVEVALVSYGFNKDRVRDLFQVVDAGHALGSVVVVLSCS